LITNSVDFSEKHVFDSIKEGNASAFEMIFRTYYQSLCNYAYSFLSDKDEAEEVVQATFITIWEKRASVSIDTSFKSYLYRAVRNSCLNVIKHEKVKQQHASYQVAYSESSVESVSQAVQASELENKIQEAMKALPEQCRLVFQLSRFEELKYAEIAEQLQISVKTVENHMGKALKIMREQLKDYLPLFLIFMKDWM
jgi:RNA polymerase sigma-70 factor, ECF subfamily